jgi:sec-independent protein translocase protein TatB
MFDIGFSEMLVIGVVALVVIGPERLPKVARTLGHLFGRLQRYVTQVKTDINREMELAELGKVKSEFESAARSFQADMESRASQAERDIREVQESIDRELAAKSGEAAASPAPEAPPASPQLELGIDPPGPPAGDKPAG